MKVTLVKAIRRINQAADAKLTKEKATDLREVLNSLLTVEEEDDSNKNKDTSDTIVNNTVDNKKNNESNTNLKNKK